MDGQTNCINGGGLGGATVSVEGNKESRAGVYGDKDGKVAAIGVSCEDLAAAKQVPTEEYGYAAVGAKGLG